MVQAADALKRSALCETPACAAERNSSISLVVVGRICDGMLGSRRSKDSQKAFDPDWDPCLRKCRSLEPADFFPLYPFVHISGTTLVKASIVFKKLYTNALQFNFRLTILKLNAVGLPLSVSTVTYQRTLQLVLSQYMDLYIFTAIKIR